MSLVNKGVVAAWKPPPIPMFPRVWMRESNQYSLGHLLPPFMFLVIWFQILSSDSFWRPHVERIFCWIVVLLLSKIKLSLPVSPSVLSRYLRMVRLMFDPLRLDFVIRAVVAVQRHARTKRLQVKLFIIPLKQKLVWSFECLEWNLAVFGGTCVCIDGDVADRKELSAELRDRILSQHCWLSRPSGEAYLQVCDVVGWLILRWISRRPRMLNVQGLFVTRFARRTWTWIGSVAQKSKVV